MEKPHKGSLRQAVKILYGNQWLYDGIFDGHPQYHGKTGYTSFVVKDWSNQPWKNGGFEIETMNSRYTVYPKTEELTFLNS